MRYNSGQAALPTVLPGLEQLVLILQTLPLPFHAPLTLSEPLQALLVLLKLFLQLLPFPPQFLCSQLALFLPFLQLALLLHLLALSCLALSLPALLFLAQPFPEPLGCRHFFLAFLQVALLLLLLQGVAAKAVEGQAVAAGRGVLTRLE